METQLRMGSPGSELLGLGSVLVASLPAALMTAEAPERYTVEAVFTRRPEQDEKTEILGSGTRDFLVKAGYPNVEVTISDRRLKVVNTNLEELRDGLAHVLADRLAEISAVMQARRDAATLRFHDAAEDERIRAQAVIALAESVTFETSIGAGERMSDSERAERSMADRAQINDWADEGGRGRGTRPDQ